MLTRSWSHIFMYSNTHEFTLSMHCTKCIVSKFLGIKRFCTHNMLRNSGLASWGINFLATIVYWWAEIAWFCCFILIGIGPLVFAGVAITLTFASMSRVFWNIAIYEISKRWSRNCLWSQDSIVVNVKFMTSLLLIVEAYSKGKTWLKTWINTTLLPCNFAISLYTLHFQLWQLILSF